MSNYYKTDGGNTIVEARGPGRRETKLSDGATLQPPDGVWTDELAAACGFVPIDATSPRPADTSTDTFDRQINMVGTVPTVQWVQRPKTQAELDAEAQQTQDDADMVAFLALKNDFIAFRDSSGPQSNAELSQISRKLCRGMLRLMRFYE